jgi:hypothetical protein
MPPLSGKGRLHKYVLGGQPQLVAAVQAAAERHLQQQPLAVRAQLLQSLCVLFTLGNEQLHVSAAAAGYGSSGSSYSVTFRGAAAPNAPNCSWELVVDGPAQWVVELDGVLLRMLPQNPGDMLAVQYVFSCQYAHQEAYTWCLAAAAMMGLLVHRQKDSRARLLGILGARDETELNLLQDLYDLGLQHKVMLVPGTHLAQQQQQ